MFTTSVLDAVETHALVDGHVRTSPETLRSAPHDDGDVEDPALSSFARCSDGHGTLSSLFFSEDPFDQARAQAVCRTCGLAPACLAGAIERGEPAGVWGGKILVDGVAVDVKRRRGRPPKTPRPVPIVDEVPLPPHLVA